MRERTRCYTRTAPQGLRILHHQTLLKSAQSVSSATIRDSDKNINMLKKSAEIPKQYAEIPKQKHPKQKPLTGLKAGEGIFL